MNNNPSLRLSLSMVLKRWKRSQTTLEPGRSHKWGHTSKSIGLRKRESHSISNLFLSLSRSKPEMLPIWVNPACQSLYNKPRMWVPLYLQRRKEKRKLDRPVKCPRRSRNRKSGRKSIIRPRARTKTRLLHSSSHRKHQWLILYSSYLPKLKRNL